MSSILIIERHLPYTGGARTESFAALWSDMGWDVKVLTRDPPASPFPLEDLEGQLPGEVEVERVYAEAPGSRPLRGLWRLFRPPVPDPEWVGPALNAARRWLDRSPPDLVYSSSPAESAHMIGERLAESWRRPWVMDVRDLFTQYEGRFGAITPLHALWARRMEAGWYRDADLVVVNTPLHLQRLRESFPLYPEKTLVVPNGYLEEDRRWAAVPRPPGPVGPGRPLRLGYLGLLAKGANAWQAVLEGLALARGRGVAAVLELWGREEPPIRERAHELGCADAVRGHPMRPHRRAMEELAVCDVLLSATAPGFGHLVPQKLYNYLALDRHILVVAPEGSMPTRVVRTTRAGTVVDPEASPVSEAIEMLARRLDRGELPPSIDEEARVRYSRSEHARELSEVFRTLLDRHE
ncbi:MAG: glycosyltransferase [bacterium]